MNNETPINVDGSPDLMGKAGQLLHAMRERAGKAVCQRYACWTRVCAR